MDKYLPRKRWFRRARIERLEEKRPLSGDFVLSLGTPRTAEAASEPPEDAQARFRLEVTDQQGNGVSQVEVGQQFTLQVSVQDLRGDAATGVFSPYLDIVYEGMLASVAGQVTFGDTYRNLNSADTSRPGLIDEAGGGGFVDEFVEEFSVGDAAGAEYLLLSVPMVANAPGELNFLGNSADLRPNHDLYFFAAARPIPAHQVDYGSTFVSIVTPETTIIDNGDSGFEAQGRWVDYSGIGFQHELLFSGAGTGSDQARWTFPVTPGRYRVSATWSPHRNRATNAPYTISIGNVRLDEVRINQEVAPADFAADGTSWAILGTYDVVGDRLSVALSDNANEFVIADAVRIERLGEPVRSPQLQLLYDGRIISSGGGIDFGAVVADDPVFKTFTVTNSGTDVLSLEPLNTIVMPRRFRLLADFAEKSLQPGESTTFTIQMLTDRPLATNAVLEIRSNAAASPFELVLRGNVRPMPFRAPSPIQIVDDGDGNHQVREQWMRYGGIGAAGDVMFAPAGTGAATSQWIFHVEPGYYRVEATWAAHPNRASNAPFTVHSNGEILGQVEVNQRLVPQGRVLAGVRWEPLGTYQVDSNSVIVQLSNDADGYVIADAVRLERVAAPVAQDTSTRIVDNGDEGFSASGSWQNFSGVGRDRDVLFSRQGVGDAIAQWSFIVSPGQYRISTTWAPHPNRASDAPYEIRADGNLLGSQRVNQRGAPAGFRADGSMWQDLGTFAVPGNSLVVQLSDAANGFVIADAVRIEQLS